jgi:hypothetical protein
MEAVNSDADFVSRYAAQDGLTLPPHRQNPAHTGVGHPRRMLYLARQRGLQADWVVVNCRPTPDAGPPSMPPSESSRPKTTGLDTGC